MTRFKRPDVWFTLAIVLIGAAGVFLINNHTCRSLDDRDWRWHAKMNAWQASFDAFSATCGAGLLTTDVNEEYTPAGRWLLSGLGLVGALLYAAAVAAAVRRLWVAGSQSVSPPRTRAILITLIATVAVSIPLVSGLERLLIGATQWTDAGGWNGSAIRAIAAAASLGWLPGAPPRACMWVYAAVAFLAALAWTVWLLPRPAQHGTRGGKRSLIAWAAGYLGVLVLLAVLVFALEAPRGSAEPPGDDAVLTARAPGVRFERSLIQTVCAAAAGLPTESLAERHVTDGTKVVLGGTMLLSPLVWVLLGGGIACIAFGRGSSEAARHGAAAGTACLLLLCILATVVALGLLIIESHTASKYQSPPTFADAFLDASSAVGNGGLTSGVIDAITGRKLSRGIRQTADAYQYGMVWLMAAMLAGRVLPLFVLCQAGRVRPGAPPYRTP